MKTLRRFDSNAEAFSFSRFYTEEHTKKRSGTIAPLPYSIINYKDTFIS